MECKNRVMLIGSIRAGKSTLAKALLGIEIQAKKTQALTYYDWIVDTPGEYTENPLYYKSIMATALEVTHVMYIQDATNEKTIFPPGFSTGIPKLPIGVITKADSDQANLKRGLTHLRKAMHRGPIVIASAYTGQGIQEIRDIVQLNSLAQMKAYCLQTAKDYLFFHSFKS